MNRTKAVVIGGLVAVGMVAGTGAAIASGDDSEQPITGDALDRATAVAIAHTGGGEVTETEIGDEESYYEVEITMDDGRQIDVQLDEAFAVVGTETDSESENDGD